MTLRPYQKECHDAAIEWIRKSIDPCLIEAATGSGKSHIIAAIAATMHKMSGGKHILCLAPNADLVHQNRDKYLATGNPASVFSSSAGGRCLRHPVVFGTPGTVVRSIKAFGSRFCAVVVDEAHGITPTLMRIISTMREQNPNLRVIGLSATPYRLGEGYVYAMDQNGQPMGEQCCKDPYFTAKVCEVPAHLLIEQGYLTRPKIGAINSGHYETLGMQPNRAGKFSSADVDQAYHGHGRLTSAIVADVVAQSRYRKGVMLFAATVQHAEEIMASLPPGLSRMIGGKINTGKGPRKKLVADFKAQKFKYLVSVQTMTTGVDFTHVDVIAILRATESVALLQQIIGRGLRIHEGKDDVLILDYAENLERHCPDGDIFNPEIRAQLKGTGGGIVEAECPECGCVNKFSARRNEDNLEIDKYGYFVDLAGNRIETPQGDMPAHYGRRCQGLVKNGPVFDQCQARWTLKRCPACDAENDIAARYCGECRHELVDPNDKLKADFKRYKRDPYQIQTDVVINMEEKPTLARSGKECLMVTYTTAYRSFTVWLHPWAERGRFKAEHLQYTTARDASGGIKTVTYSKDKDSGFYRVYDYNRPEDKEPE